LTISIRRRLLANLIITIAFVSLITLYLSYDDARHEVQELFDAELAQSGRVLQALLIPDLLVRNTEEELQELLQRFNTIPAQALLGPDMAKNEFGHAYERRLAFQVWNGDKKLLLHSAAAPIKPMSQRGLEPQNRGFSDEMQGTNKWRVFSVWDETDTYLIQVGEYYAVRDELISKISRQLITPSLISLPFLGLMIWVGIGRGLRPVQKVADEVTRRDPSYLEPVQFAPVPSEVRPLVNSLNHLLDRLREALEAERRFTDDAAHELRTPLAALKTQAQVALRSNDDEERSKALVNVVNSVDRASHVVEQLLTLARLDPASDNLVITTINLHQQAADVVAQLVPAAIAKNINMEITGIEDAMVLAEPVSISILIRNLVDNAIRYTPAGGEVVLNIEKTSNNNVILSVSDTGPGIQNELQARVFDRFFRLGSNISSGCGLGLSIVKRVADHNGLLLNLENRADGHGLIVSAYFNVAANRAD